MYWRLVPIIARIGFALSNTSFSPQTNIVSSPVIAFGVLPVTGASRKEIHRSESLLPILSAHLTPIVDISMTIPHGVSESIIPSLPKMTSSTSSPAVTIVMRISIFFASSILLKASLAPRDTSSFTFSGVRFHTVRSPHFEMIFFAIGIPMSPRPINQIRIEKKLRE